MKSLWALVILAGIPFVAHAEEWVCCNEAEVLLDCGGVAELDDEYCACYCVVHPDDSRCAVTTSVPETTGGDEETTGGQVCSEGQTYIKAAYTGGDDLLDGTGVCCSNVVSLDNPSGVYQGVDQICCDNPTSNIAEMCDWEEPIGTGTPETTRPTTATNADVVFWKSAECQGLSQCGAIVPEGHFI